jgi:hypothetical protein
VLDDLQPLTLERTLMRLAEIAAARGGTLSAVDVEQDDYLARDRPLTAAAARMLAAGSAVADESPPTSWFPFKLISFKELPPPRVEIERT